MTDLVVLGAKGSPFVRKVQVVLAEKGVPYEIEMVMPFPPSEDFLRINPAGRIPVLRDRSVGTEGEAGTIPDSSAICAYLEQMHPDPPLYPSEPFARARALWYEEFADSVLAGPIGIGMFRPMVMGAMMGKERDVDRARKTLHEDLPAHFDYLERQLQGHGYLVGEAFSIADISVATQLVNMRHAGGRVDGARWPQLLAWAERIHERPSFAACIAEEETLFKPHGIEL